jgi:ABC-type multidrug transport system fused ATPase/permease subunit
VPILQVLFSASIEENIKFGRPEATLEEVRAAAAAANAGFVDALPEGFSTQVRRRHTDGKRQRCPANCVLLYEQHCARAAIPR